MNLLLMFNPYAGGGRARSRLTQICEQLESAGFNVSVSVSEYSGHIEHHLSEASLEDIDVVAVAGGDGTLSQAVNGMMRRPVESRKPLGLIPVGTGNAFARDIGLQPEVTTELSDKIKVDYNKIKVDDKAIDKNIEELRDLILLGDRKRIF